jgi:hypothetical protein
MDEIIILLEQAATLLKAQVEESGSVNLSNAEIRVRQALASVKRQKEMGGK